MTDVKRNTKQSVKEDSFELDICLEEYNPDEGEYEWSGDFKINFELHGVKDKLHVYVFNSDSLYANYGVAHLTKHEAKALAEQLNRLIDKMED